MIDVLRQKTKELFRGDEGVALVVTLALFMFLYVSCAGVFAVGRAVKERVLLQNAADAAAYSAAVAQADVLSRIAVINRAMAWTYEDMIQCQHDYVLLTWLKVACDEYDKDSATYGGRVYADLAGTKKGKIDLNGKEYDIEEVRDAVEKLEGISERIQEDSNRLQDLYVRSSDLIKELVGEVPGSDVGIAEAIVRRILEANLSGEYGKQCLRKLVMRDDWWDIEDNENGFLRLDSEVLAAHEKFDFDEWLHVSDKSVCRYYMPSADENVARWTYRVTDLALAIPHEPDIESSKIGEDKRSLVAFNPSSEDYTAKPIVLMKAYFPADGGKGAISVCVAHRTDNPWKFGGTALDGLYDAFKPFSEHTRWARAVASAQAGYRDGTDEGAYSVRWKEGGVWNLGTNDWDAVFVPIRKVFTPDAFKELVVSDSKWNKVLEDGYDGLVHSYSEGVNNATHLPRMHNNGETDNQLDWGADGSYRFLDLIFH